MKILNALRPARDPFAVPRAFLRTTDEAVALVERLRTAEAIGVDTETVFTPGRVDPFTAQLRVISVAARWDGVDERAYVIDVRDIDKAQLGAALRAAKLTVFGFNANFDDPVTTLNLSMPGERYRPVLRWNDLMLSEAALRQGRFGNTWYASLADVAKARLGVVLDGKGTVQLSYDADTDLTDEQIDYAAQDAVITLWLGDEIKADIVGANLVETQDLEWRSRPFIQKMTVFGIPLDRDAWMEYVERRVQAAKDLLTTLAELTGGGGQLTFDGSVEMSWNPNSDVDVKRVLNEHARDRVLAYTAAQAKGGQGHLLGKEDSTDKNALAQIGGPLAETVLKWRKESKLETTYGSKMMDLLGPDSRFHSNYTQCLIDTGRLSSRDPNAQNFSPEMKPFMRPLAPGRVFVAGDLSQAELRFLAQMSGDKALLHAYTHDIDVHVNTATRMFKIDLLALEADGKREVAEAEAALAAATTDADREAANELAASGKKKLEQYKVLRAKGKINNFSIAYGAGAANLATQLTVAGIPTSREEAAELLRLYAEAYPDVTKWLQARAATINDLAEQVAAGKVELDFNASWQLHKLFARADAARKALRRSSGVKPDAADVTEALTPRSEVEAELSRSLGRDVTADELQAEMDRRTARVEWALSYLGSVVLTPDGTPFSFESRTSAGRRRLFEVGTDTWVTSMMLIAARSFKDRPRQLREAWGKDHDVEMSAPNGRVLSKEALLKRFEDKALKLDFVSYVLDNIGPEGAAYLMRQGVADRVRAMGNAYRNAPIQGGVADAVLLAYALLDERLEAFDTAFPVMSVHDSIVIECDAKDAEAIRDLLRSTMEEALGHYCPDVPVVADVDVQANLKDVIEPEELQRMLELAA